MHARFLSVRQEKATVVLHIDGVQFMGILAVGTNSDRDSGQPRRARSDPLPRAATFDFSSATAALFLGLLCQYSRLLVVEASGFTITTPLPISVMVD